MGLADGITNEHLNKPLGNVPGIQPVIETFDAAIFWSTAYQLKWWNAQIASTASDPTAA